MAFHDINQSLPEASSRGQSPIAFKLDVHLKVDLKPCAEKRRKSGRSRNFATRASAPKR